MGVSSDVPAAVPIAVAQQVQSVQPIAVGVVGRPAITISSEAPKTDGLKCAAVLLGLLGLVQVLSVAGILALCVLCKVGCCCGASPAALVARASSIKCLAMATAIFAGIQCGGAVAVSNYLAHLCGIFVVDSSNALQSAAYDAGVAAIGVGTAAWQVANPTASTPRVQEGTSGNFEYALVFPPDVCSYMPNIESAGNGIYYPHPFSSFADNIRLSLLIVNGATVALAVLVAALASNVVAASRVTRTVYAGNAYTQYP